jgi:hypothetical protein
MNASKPRYTCKEYREEMTLLSLRQRLFRDDLSDEEKERIRETIDRLTAEMGME